MNKIELADYEIQFDDSLQSLSTLFSTSNYSQVFILVDENTKQHCLPVIQHIVHDVKVIEIKSGEEHKNLSTCESIWQQLIINNADRKCVLINLGGGVIGDMGGFAASCYKRGIDFINIPTTVLSQVDSSIGGKLGIDFKYGKNLIGLFRNPKLVLISSRFFATLPERQFVNGWAEIFKHALIQDAAQWKKYQDRNELHENIKTVVYESLSIKKKIVEQDPFEKGLRKILNFGHTIGHAIEAYSLEHDEDSLLHGEAIVVGMICEAYLSVTKCGVSELELQQIQELLLHHFPKADISKYDNAELLRIIRMDKKNSGAKVLFALLEKIGSCIYDVEVSDEEIIEALNYYRNL